MASRTMKIRPLKIPKITGSSTMISGMASMVMPQMKNSTMYKAMKMPMVTASRTGWS